MLELVNALLVLVLVLNLFALGTSRIQSLIRIVAVQGLLLGIITLCAHETMSAAIIASAAAAILIKAVLIPSIMTKSLQAADIKREIEPFIGFMPSVLLGAAATAAALLFTPALSESAVNANPDSLIIPASFSTVFVGFIILVSRYKAVTQSLGYLVLENGIFIFGILLVEAIPLVVEMGMLLDLFVGIFVISIITNHINRAFSSMDTRHLVSLKE